jgi:uncharacterized protein involved in copper resistance
LIVPHVARRTFVQGLAMGGIFAGTGLWRSAARAAKDGSLTSWDAMAWAGRDLDKLWLRTEGKRSDGATESLDVEAVEDTRWLVGLRFWF